MVKNQESIQLLNTAIIRSKENDLQGSYEERLTKICDTPAIQALSIAIDQLSESQKISRDQSAIELIQAVKNLESVWQDYVMMEGISKLKDVLKTSTNTH